MIKVCFFCFWNILLIDRFCLLMMNEKLFSLLLGGVVLERGLDFFCVGGVCRGWDEMKFMLWLFVCGNEVVIWMDLFFWVELWFCFFWYLIWGLVSFLVLFDFDEDFIFLFLILFLLFLVFLKVFVSSYWYGNYIEVFVFGYLGIYGLRKIGFE